MLCQNCGENEANVRYTQIINGEKKEMILCEKCSKNLGIEDIDFSMPIDFSSFFGGILGCENEQDFISLNKRLENLKCKFCGMKYDDFTKTGKFGCGSCYEAFSEKIDPILKRIHGSNRYIGKKIEILDKNITKEQKTSKEEEKTKVNISEVQKIERLKNELKQLIKEEKYEEAAKIRDEIKNIEK